MKYLSFPCWPFTANSTGQKLSPSTHASISRGTLTLLGRPHWCFSVNSNACFTDNMLVLFLVIHYASLDTLLYEILCAQEKCCSLPNARRAGRRALFFLSHGGQVGTGEQAAVADDTFAIPKGPNSILNAEWDTIHLETTTILLCCRAHLTHSSASRIVQ